MDTLQILLDKIREHIILFMGGRMEINQVILIVTLLSLGISVFTKMDKDFFRRHIKTYYAQKALVQRFIKPLWLDCNELYYVLNYIKDSIVFRQKHHLALKYKFNYTPSLEWYTKDGYFSVSLAYQFARVAYWSMSIQNEVVFLPFKRKKCAMRLFSLLKELKENLAPNGSSLYYNYINIIGEELASPKGPTPITLAEFCQKLHQDSDYWALYDQLFIFIGTLSESKNQFTFSIMDEASQTLDKILKLLAKEAGIKELGRESKKSD